MADDTKTLLTIRGSKFLVGILLAWVPIVVIIVPVFFEVFRGITDQKATGLGAVAGGFSEAFVTFGVVTFVAAQVLAIILLIRSVGIGKTVQSVFAILSIGICATMLAATGLFFWIMLFVIPRLHNR
ncbi:MAG: hypothetical protein ROO76_03500 [Terriglobia bacterium]|jgi:hypothetical protein|nr:hypothetical protein [Terriglobia bacterium]